MHRLTKPTNNTKVIMHLSKSGSMVRIMWSAFWCPIRAWFVRFWVLTAAIMPLFVPHTKLTWNVQIRKISAELEKLGIYTSSYSKSATIALSSF